MKKIILFSVIACFSFTAIAQLVPNANMEEWEHIGNYDNPVGWSTPNGLYGLLKVVFKDSTEVNSGNYAAKIVATSFFGLVIPGAMGTGALDLDNLTFTGGFPLSDPNVVALIGYYKYTSVGNDSCLIYSILTHWDNVMNKRDTVAVAVFVSSTASTYTLFSSPYAVLNANTPDSALIILATANNVDAAESGSTLWIDDIDFTKAVGIPEIKNSELSVYPNPADQSFLLSLPKEIHASTILISSMDGKRIKDLPVNNQSSFSVNTASFIPGVYVMFARDQHGTVTATGKFTVKH
ncbi:MAG: T9SS type A sorting domain-containing protein [Chitinophagales bacterium]